MFKIQFDKKSKDFSIDVELVGEQIIVGGIIGAVFIGGIIGVIASWGWILGRVIQ